MGKRHRLAFLLVLLAGLSIRLYHLGDTSIWLDEACSIYMSVGPLNDLVETLHRHQDVTPPGYLVLLHFWQMVGHSETWLRLLSVLWSAVGLVATWFLVPAASLRSRVAATSLMAVSAIMIGYAQEVRMYSQGLALAMVGQAFFLRGLAGSRSRIVWSGYVLAMVGAMLTEYLTAFYGFGQLVALLAMRPPREVWRRFGLAMGAGVLLLMPAVISQSHHLAFQAWFPFHSLAVLDLVSTAFGGLFGDTLVIPDWWLALTGQPGAQWTYVLLMSLGLALVAAYTVRGLRALPAAAAWLLGSTFTLCLGGLAVATVLTHFQFWVGRYIYTTYPALFVTLGWGLANASRRSLAWVAAAVVLVSNLSSWYHLDFDPAFRMQDWRSVNAFVASKIKANSVVIVVPAMAVLPLCYYYHSPATLVPLDQANDAVLKARTEHASPVILCSITGDLQTSGIKEWLQSHLHLQDEVVTPNADPWNRLEVQVFDSGGS
ncbi:MAG TPA: hypothetical protein VGO93_06215 [Candidatus Xenobia bacterium]|jgi:hypothetical protein